MGIGDDGTLEIDASILYPNTMIYRDFPYGTNLHLVLGDSRTYRPDHLVPEDAYPRRDRRRPAGADQSDGRSGLRCNQGRS